MFGMAGGSAGQFLVGPMIAAGVSLKTFWACAGVAGLLIAAILFWLLPTEQRVKRQSGRIQATTAALGSVFKNPQSILCGIVGGLLFIPTTIFGMTWGVQFLQQGHGFSYGEAVMRSATLPLGWIIGCPLLGSLSDRLGRRKPVIIGGACVLFGCLTWILYAPSDAIPPYVVGIVTGLASGAAMLPYTVIKEANPPELSGTATGVISFLIFTLSALLGPVFAGILQHVSSGEELGFRHYRTTFQPLLYGVGLAIVLTFLLKETGAKVRAPQKVVKTA
jgi:MFS family permease